MAQQRHHGPLGRAEDGSWSTGSIDPAGVAAVTFDRPGTYVYICKEHPWAYARIIVE